MDTHTHTHSQDASVVLLLITLVDDITDEDVKMVNSVIMNDVTNIRDQQRLLDSVLKIHQEPEKKPRRHLLNQILACFSSFVSHFGSKFLQKLISVNVNITK